MVSLPSANFYRMIQPAFKSAGKGLMTENVSSINIKIRRKEMKSRPFVGFQTCEKTSCDISFGRISENYHEHRWQDNIYTHKDTSSSSNTSHCTARRIPMTGVIKATKIDQHNYHRTFVCADNKVFLFFSDHGFWEIGELFSSVSSQSM